MAPYRPDNSSPPNRESTGQDLVLYRVVINSVELVAMLVLVLVRLSRKLIGEFAGDAGAHLSCHIPNHLQGASPGV